MPSIVLIEPNSAEPGILAINAPPTKLAATVAPG